jgi:F0F1-type ATP synthase membrane subunit c/vacuolar-type H+-ATPase subunit K
MYDSSQFLHYATIASTIIANSISVGIGQGLTSFSAIQSINRQPQAKNDIIRVSIIGMTLIETVAILAVLIAIILIVNTSEEATYYTHLSEIGIACALCLTGFVVGLVSALPAQAATHAIARQPHYAQKIFAFMLMTQVLIQTPIISAFIVSWFIQVQSASTVVISDCLRLIASGLCVGIGSIGPTIGLSLFAKAAIQGIGTNPRSYNKLLSFTFISEAIIETPIIFCLIIAVALLFIVQKPLDQSPIEGVIFIASALCLGFGTLGPGISSGKTGAAACTQISYNPESASILSRTSMLAQGLIETVVIYALLLSLLMILFK